MNPSENIEVASKDPEEKQQSEVQAQPDTDLNPNSLAKEDIITSKTSKEQIEEFEKNEPEKYEELKGFKTKGDAARRKDEYKLAIDNYTEALNILPSHYILLYNRGICYKKSGDIHKAIEDYSEAC